MGRDITYFMRRHRYWRGIHGIVAFYPSFGKSK